MALTARQRFANVGATPASVIPPFPRRKFSDRFRGAFPDDVKFEQEYHAEVEEWRKKTNHILTGNPA